VGKGTYGTTEINGTLRGANNLANRRVASSLFYAGWQASDLKTQLESAVRLGKEVMQTQQAMSKELMELKVKDQMIDAKIVQIEQRLVKVEK